MNKQKSFVSKKIPLCTRCSLGLSKIFYMLYVRIYEYILDKIPTRDSQDHLFGFISIFDPKHTLSKNSTKTKTINPLPITHTNIHIHNHSPWPTKHNHHHTVNDDEKINRLYLHPYLTFPKPTITKNHTHNHPETEQPPQPQPQPQRNTVIYANTSLRVHRFHPMEKR